MIWLFLGALAVVLVVMAVVAQRTDRNIIPVDVDATWLTIGAFYRNRPDRTTEVDLGNEWVSTYDPGAVFEVSWIKDTRELVALRHQAHAGMIGGAGIIAALPSTRGMNAKTGMKVLAVVDLRELHRLHPHRLEPLADGLDQLTAGLGAPYQPPRPGDAHWSSAELP